MMILVASLKGRCRKAALAAHSHPKGINSLIIGGCHVD